MMASQNSVRINIEGQKAAKDINVYRTSAKENLKHIKSSFSLDKLIAIPTKSVVTIVIDFEDAINTGISISRQIRPVAMTSTASRANWFANMQILQKDSPRVSISKTERNS